MGFVKTLKLEFYQPQLNKAEKKVAYYRQSVAKYEEKQRQQVLSRKDDGVLGYHAKMLLSWELDLERLQAKVTQIKRS